MRPSVLMANNAEKIREILERFRMGNPRLFGSAARGEDTETSDLDILVDAPRGTTMYDLGAAEIELEAILGCKVEIVTDGFLAPDVAANVAVDLVPLP